MFYKNGAGWDPVSQRLELIEHFTEDKNDALFF